MAAPCVPPLTTMTQILTSPQLPPEKTPANSGAKLQRVTPPQRDHLTFHAYRQLQQSPPPSTSEPFDHKRVRRKAAQANLGGIGYIPTAARLLARRQRPSPHSIAIEPFIAPRYQLQPPPPQPRPSLESPSLSSTVSTALSSPTETPKAYESAFCDRWEPPASEASEVIRTKRKFSQLRRPKRLPHAAAQSSWRVYAFVSERDFEEEAFGSQNDLCQEPQGELEVIEQEGVRGKETEPTGTSTFTLSKFQFPTPPTYRAVPQAVPQADRPFSEPAPSTSPAILHYRGASFDVVNPHTSLFLHDIETPAEIDGLLDDYFHDSDMADHSTEARSAMQSSSVPSLASASESARKPRVLYDTFPAARKNIMGEDSFASPSNSIEHQGELIAAATPSYVHGRIAREANSESSSAFKPDPLFASSKTPKTKGFGAAVRRKLFGGAAGDEDRTELQQMDDARNAAADQQYAVREKLCREGASSLYPADCRRSNPFDLDVENADDSGMSQEALAYYTEIPRQSGFFGERPQRKKSVIDGQQQAKYSDQANELTQEQDTLSKIVTGYGYDRPVMQYDLSTRSSLHSLAHGYEPTPSEVSAVSEDEEGRIDAPKDGDLLTASSGTKFALARSHLDTDNRVSRSVSPLADYEYRDTHVTSRVSRSVSPLPELQYRGNQRSNACDNANLNAATWPAPPPPGRIAEHRRPPMAVHASSFSEAQTYEQTYGDTGNLLGLTPQIKHHGKENALPSSPAPFLRPPPPVKALSEGEIKRISHASNASMSGSIYMFNSYGDEVPVKPSNIGVATTSDKPSFPKIWDACDTPGGSRTNLATESSRNKMQSHSSSLYPNTEDGWEDVEESQPQLPTLAGRPSGDSFAGTDDEYFNELPMPHLLSRPANPCPRGSSNFTFSTVDTVVSAVPYGTITNESTNDRASITSSMAEIGERTAGQYQPTDDYLLPAPMDAAHLPPSPKNTETFNSYAQVSGVQPTRGRFRNDHERYEYIQAQEASFTGDPYAVGGDPADSYARDLDFSPTNNTMQTMNAPQEHNLTTWAHPTQAQIASPQSAKSKGKQPARLAWPAKVTPEASRTHTQLSKPDVPITPMDYYAPRKNDNNVLRRPRSFVPGQIEMQRLHLAPRDAFATDRAQSRQTDSMLMRAEPNWSMDPHRHLSSPVSHQTGRTAHTGASALSTRYNLSNYGSNEHLVRAPGRANDTSERQERQKKLSWLFFCACCLFPPLLLLYGCGAFDWCAVRISRGEMRAFDRTQKELAVGMGGVLLGMLIVVAVLVPVLVAQ